MTTLLDSSVLIALVVDGHVHALDSRKWLARINEPFATCPITQGSLVRYIVRQNRPCSVALQLLARVTDQQRHVFWPDNIGYEAVRMDGVFGHAQVTDAYLAQLARVNGGRLATFDQGFAGLHSDVADLVPTG